MAIGLYVAILILPSALNAITKEAIQKGATPSTPIDPAVVTLMGTLVPLLVTVSILLTILREFRGGLDYGYIGLMGYSRREQEAFKEEIIKMHEWFSKNK